MAKTPAQPRSSARAGAAKASATTSEVAKPVLAKTVLGKTEPAKSEPAKNASSVDQGAAGKAGQKKAGQKKTGQKKTGRQKSGPKKTAAATAEGATRSRPFGRFSDWFNARVGKPTSAYYWIVGIAVTLTMIGRMTVLSASTAETISKGQDPYDLFIKESGFAVIGFVLMFALSCVPVKVWRKGAPFLLGLAIILLGLVFTPLGVNVQGNLNWLNFGGLQFQPSETAKLALAIWMGAVLAAKGLRLRKLVHVLPVALWAAVVMGLILLGHDLGTTVIVGMMVLAGLWFGGVPKRFLAVAGGAAVVVALVANLSSGNRTGRFSAWLGDCSVPGACDQYLNGAYALASGGWFGVGLGQSRQKWNWIPEAHNDFIFAIIGEEFGLLGTIVIVSLYAVLAFSIFRVINSRNDPFSRVVCGMILTWIIGQAIVNIAVVVGLLPVIGVPLPLISYGGTALVMVLAAIGVVLSFSRTEPFSHTLPESSLKIS